MFPSEAYILQVQAEEKRQLPTFEYLERDFAQEVEQLASNYQLTGTKEVPIKMKIVLEDETPISRPPYRLAPKERKDVDAQTDEWLEQGVIRTSNCEFSSNVVVAIKKDDSARVCINYKPLNKVVIREKQPLLLIEDVVDQLVNVKVYSTIDLKNGFLRVPIDEESRKYTSFVKPKGQWEFCKVPFGVYNSQPVFQRYVHYIFRELIKLGIVLIYLDDIVVLANTLDEALEHLRRLLEIASAYGLQINWKKSKILQRQIEFLGYTIQENKIRPSKDKVQALINFPVLRNLRKVQSFLGLASYFRKFVKGFSKKASPLSDLLRKDVCFVFGEAQRNFFRKLKEALTMAPVLTIFDPRNETKVHTDASQDGFGAILMQKCSNDQKWHPIY